MATRLGQAIRAARLESRQTQQELGKRLGVKASAVQRWEAGRSKPPPRKRRALPAAIAALNAKAGARLQAMLEADAGIVAPAGAATTTAAMGVAMAAAPPQPHAATGLPGPSPPAAERSALELLVYRMADDLDLPPRRMRGALTRLLRSVRANGLSLEQLERELAAWAQHLE